VPQVEAAHVFIGVPNEHFLHHRRHSRGDRRCRFPGIARLNEQFDATQSGLSTRLTASQRTTREIGLCTLRVDMVLVGTINDNRYRKAAIHSRRRVIANGQLRTFG
jgi:hypothetical protein